MEWPKPATKQADPLGRHRNLHKAQSSLLVQARVGAIGLRNFLHTMGVPEIQDPHCPCGARETAPHLFLRCPLLERPEDGPANLPALTRALNDAEKARPLLSWLMRTGRLREYRLAIEINDWMDQDNAANSPTGEDPRSTGRNPHHPARGATARRTRRIAHSLRI